MSSVDDIAGKKRLAIVGVAKNCGKTTTLNQLLRLRRKKGLAPPSLVSAGIDGESEDVLLGTDKPPICVDCNQWVATAEATLRKSTARFEYVKSPGISTPLGEVFICRAVEAGSVMLGGLRHRRELIDSVEALAEFGPGPVWVDGAYGRVVGAHPDVAQQVVVATGAVCGGDTREVVEKTEDLVSRLNLEAIDEDDETGRQAMERAVADECVTLVDAKCGVVALETASAVVGLEELAQIWGPTVEAVAIPGLVSDRVVEELLAFGEHRLYVCDATTIHAEERIWKRFRNCWDVRVARPVRVVGISYNPTSVTGSTIEPARLESLLCERFSEIAVFNPLNAR